MNARNGFIIMAISFFLIIIVNSDGVKLKECSVRLKDTVEMWLNPADLDETPREYIPLVDKIHDESQGRQKATAEVRGRTFYLVGNGWKTFWTTEESFLIKAPCNDVESIDLFDEDNWGCGNPYRPNREPQYYMMPQFGQQLGYDGRGVSLENGQGWGFVTWQEGEWRVTPKLPYNPFGDSIKVYVTYLSEECLDALPDGE